MSLNLAPRIAEPSVGGEIHNLHGANKRLKPKLMDISVQARIFAPYALTPVHGGVPAWVQNVKQAERSHQARTEQTRNNQRLLSKNSRAKSVRGNFPAPWHAGN
jgi:hypothetical protein